LEYRIELNDILAGSKEVWMGLTDAQLLPEILENCLLIALKG
jgi:hypothetical protein